MGRELHVPALQRVEEPDAIRGAADLDHVLPGELQQVCTYSVRGETRRGEVRSQPRASGMEALVFPCSCSQWSAHSQTASAFPQGFSSRLVLQESVLVQSHFPRDHPSLAGPGSSGRERPINVKHFFSHSAPPRPQLALTSEDALGGETTPVPATWAMESAVRDEEHGLQGAPFTGLQ